MAIERRTEEKETSPFTLMRRLSDDMERMFEDTWGARRFPRMFRRLEVPESRWAPNIEAFERKGEFVVRAELPGMTKDNVKVEVEKTSITSVTKKRQG